MPVLLGVPRSAPQGQEALPVVRQADLVRSGPDGLTHLLQEADLPVLEEAWQEHYAKQVAEEAIASNREAARMTMESLRSYAEVGVDEVEVLGADDEDTCPACRAARLRGRYRLEHAPSIPVVGCSNEICRCSLAPIVAAGSGGG